MKASVLVVFVIALAVLLLAQAKNPAKNKELKEKNLPVIDQKKLPGRKAADKAAPVRAATTTYGLFPYAMTDEALHPYQQAGCQCNVGDPMFFSPEAVDTKVNTPVQIRYDASRICFKQGITDSQGQPYPNPIDSLGNMSVGYVQWEVGAVSDNLPHEYGILTYSGYSQPVQETITVEVHLRCIDKPNNKNSYGDEVCGASGYNECTLKATIPVTVR
jgi:hypothetical protein